MEIDLRGRSLLTLHDFSRDEILHLLDLAESLKAEKRQGEERQRLEGKNIALIFEKTSTRTRCAFEVAAYDQGSHVTYLDPSGSQMGHKESIKDTARVLGRMYDGIEYRGFGQERIEALARYAGVPVWNGLTDQYHPTQALGDVMTMAEQRPDAQLSEISFCYLGDARNNVASSLLLGASILGMDIRLAAPKSLWPAQELRDRAAEHAEASGASIAVTESVEEAVRGVHFLYTDVWLSMGEPASRWSERIELLRPYQINSEVLEMAGSGSVKCMHCLPAFHNRETTVGEQIYQEHGLESMEITEDVFESDACIVFDQAENRVHTIKAVLVATLGE